MRSYNRYIFLCLLILNTSCTEKKKTSSIVLSPEAIKTFNQASIAYEKNNLTSASKWLDSTLVLTPNFAKALHLQGDLYRDLRLFSKSDSMYRLILESDQNAGGVWFKLGTNAFLRELHDEAIEYFEMELAVVEGEPIKVRAQIARARALKGDHEAAMLAFRQIEKEDSSFATIWPWISDLHEMDGNMEEAYSYARKSVARLGGKTELLYKMGLLALRTQRFDEAELLLRQVLEINPRHEGASYQLGMTLTQLKKTNEAKQYLGQTDSLQNLNSEIALMKLRADNNPENPAQWLRLAGLYRDAGDDKSADEAMSKARYWMNKNDIESGN